MAKMMGKPIVIHVHAPSVEWLLSERTQWLFRTTCRLADCVIALSPWWAEQLRTGGIQTAIRVIPNPVAIPARSPSYKEEGVPPKILFVGKLEARKGYADFIKAAALVLQFIPEAQFFLAGHGEVAEAEALSRTLGIEDSIHVTGWLDRDALTQLYRSVTVFCLPSYDEGLPMSVLEAMSWGLPVVTTPVGGIPDIVEDGVNGFFVQPGQIVDIASTIARLISLSEQTRNDIGFAAQDTVLRHCDPTTISNKLAELYVDLLQPVKATASYNL